MRGPCCVTRTESHVPSLWWAVLMGVLMAAFWIALGLVLNRMQP